MRVSFPTGDKLDETRFVYKFLHGEREKTFGPHENEKAAREAFQKVYGYWPDDPIEVIPYALDDRPNR